MVENFHSGKERSQVVGYEVFEGNEPQHRSDGVGELHKSRQHRGNLNSREVLFRGLGVAHSNREVEGKARDIGERVGGVDRKGGEYGKNRRKVKLVG